MKKFVILVFFTLYTFSHAINLEELIQEAEKSNPVLKQKKLDIKIQKALRKSKRAEKFGEIDLDFMLNRYEDKRILYPITPPINPYNLVGARNQLISRISYTLPLFTGFKLENSIEISKMGETLKEISYRLTRNQVIYNIRVLYIQILSLEKQKKAFLEYKKSLEQLYRDVKEKVSLGKKAYVDLLKVEYDIKDVEANIEKIKNDISSLKAGIKVLVGKDINLSEIEDISLSDNFKIEKSISSLGKLKEVGIQEKIAEKKLKVEKGSLLPQIYLNTSFQRNTGNGEYKDLWQISLNIKYNLFDFGKRKHRILEKSLQLKKIKLQKKYITLKVEADLRKALNNIETAEYKIKATKKQLSLAKTVEDIEKTKYLQGVSDMYDYLHAKAQRYMAESSYYKALYDREIAISFLKYILEEYK